MRYFSTALDTQVPVFTHFRHHVDTDSKYYFLQHIITLTISSNYSEALKNKHKIIKTNWSEPLLHVQVEDEVKLQHKHLKYIDLMNTSTQTRWPHRYLWLALGFHGGRTLKLSFGI
jgi:hypothetical protein